MKIRRLPETDLACIAPLPTVQKRRALQQMRDAWPPHTYRPFKRSLPDILNVHPGMFAQLEPTPWDAVNEIIQKCSDSEQERDANLAVGKGLYDFSKAAQLSGRSYEFFPLALGVGQKVEYWLQMILLLDGKAVIPFIDPRRTHRLTATGRRFVFSVMHERIRVAQPELSIARLGIVQFDLASRGPRTPIVHFDDGLDLYPFETIDSMVGETYDLWRGVLAEREASARHAAGSSGSLI